MRERGRMEWPTLGLIIACYLVWVLGASAMSALSLPLGVMVCAVAIALHASLQHEVIHGHPFRTQWMNEALMFPALNLAIPYERFRDTHLAHHSDAELTDPYDDPESNFVSAKSWSGFCRAVRSVLTFNNILLGRLIVGPAVSQVVFMRSDLKMIRKRHWHVVRAWALHSVSAVLVLGTVSAMGEMPLWAYLIAAYAGLSIVKIRTFLEHRAHEKSRGRTVIIEDRGLLAFLFLNNNLHALHHMYPGVAWYELPALYRRSKVRVLRCNEGYVYRSYGEVFRSYLLARKDEVVHPLWHRD